MIPKTPEEKLKRFKSALAYYEYHKDDPTALFAILVLYAKITSGPERVDLAEVAKIISDIYKLEIKVAPTLKLLENI